MIASPRPWSLAPLSRHKYYGTRVLDANGALVFEIWLPGDKLSPREEIADGWVDWVHSEKSTTYETATAIIEAINAL